MSDSPVLIPHAFIVDHLGDYPGFTWGDPKQVGFTFDAASQIARDYALLATPEGEPARKAFYDLEGDAFRFFDPALKEWLVWVGQDVGRIRLYTIGEGAWTWRSVGDESGGPPGGSVGNDR